MADQFTKKNINRSIEAYKDNRDYSKSYERYDFMYDYMKPYFEQDPGLSFLDLGCGDGSFIHYMKKRHTEARYTGFEYSHELIEIINAEPFFEGTNIVHGDVTDFNLNEKYDMALLAGVLSIFDDVNTILDNMCNHIKPGGKGFIFGGFTEADIDVLVRFRNNHTGSDDWEGGWNMFSINTMKKILAPYSKDFEAHRFELKMELPKSETL